jgi:hypothetical protein
MTTKFWGLRSVMSKWEGEMTDRYTKVVLTIIAVCLAVIAAKDLPFMRTAVAQQPAHVIVQ